jgi:predicted dehydrogenase
MSDNLCRFGILSTAGIARKNWKAIHLSGNARVAAVASRQTGSAQRFINECSAEVTPSIAPRAVGSYESLLDDPDIDAVYIPLPTALRHQWVIKAAQAGKHVIGEKPAALNTGQVEEMLAACREHKVQYMDGVMYMHSQRLPLVRQMIDTNRIGSVRRMVSQFSFLGGEEFQRNNIRCHSELEPFGCVGDLGWYSLRFFYWLMQQKPIEVRARNLFPLQAKGSPGRVPGEFSAELNFADGVSASCYSSFRTQHQQWMHVSGEEGYLRIDDFVLPFRGAEVSVLLGHDHFMIDNCSFHMENHLQKFSIREYDAGENTAQEVRMIRSFVDQAMSGSLNQQWPEWTLHTQQILDACFLSSQRDGAVVKL